MTDLNRIDDSPWPEEYPFDINDSGWEFCFNGEPIFIVCNTPAHVKRLSRRSIGFMLTIQPRWVFEEIFCDKSKPEKAVEIVSKRLKSYDLAKRSPFLGMYGGLNNKEYLQYFLDDGSDEAYNPNIDFK